MSDVELIARLRTINKNYEMARGVHVDIRQAADRIEALITARDQHWDSLVHWRKQADDLTGQLAAAQDDAKEAEAYAGELEAKLAKAVEAAEEMSAAFYSGGNVTERHLRACNAGVKLHATLAKIKGDTP